MKIKSQALEAEKKYKRRLKAVIRIQRFWRKNRENATQKRLEWKAMKEMRRIQDSYAREYDDEVSEDIVCDMGSISIPFIPRSDSPGK